MHPVVKIVSLLLLSIFSTQGGWFTLLFTGVLILPFYIARPDLWFTALQMLSRLKWLFISILLIYFIFTPVVPAKVSSEHFSVAHELIVFIPGLFRIAVLILIIFAVNLFLKTTSREQILASLLWLFYPLRILPIDIERISLRAVLTLEYIEVLTCRMTEYKEKNKDKQGHLSLFGKQFRKKTRSGFWLAIKENLLQKKQAFFHIIDHSGIILLEILDEAANTSGKTVTIECLEPPLPLQLMIPFTLGLLFFLTL